MDREQFLTARQVSERTTFSRATIDRKVRTGEFPRPIYISRRRKVWAQSAVDQWMANACSRANLPADR
jgi:prophage regulatory protein